MKRVLILIISSLLFLLLVHRSITWSIRQALHGWREDPAKMTAKIIFSFIVGQAVFWRIGYDQLGVAMNPKFKTGLGINVGDYVYERIPHTAGVAWLVKVLEILTDAGKIPIEGAVYRKHGFAPDGVAAAVTQPLWSTIETVEKAAGATLHPERVTEPEQVKVSIGCIYGSLFRYLEAGILLLFGGVLYLVIGKPIEKALRLIFGLFR